MGNLQHAIEAAERRAALKALEEAKKHPITRIEPKVQGHGPEAKGSLLGLSEKRPRGRPKKDGALEQITLRLDPRIIAHYRATGDGWQARINEALKKSVGL